jgi:hypothetical protein
MQSTIQEKFLDQDQISAIAHKSRGLSLIQPGYYPEHDDDIIAARSIRAKQIHDSIDRVPHERSVRGLSDNLEQASCIGKTGDVCQKEKAHHDRVKDKAREREKNKSSDRKPKPGVDSKGPDKSKVTTQHSGKDGNNGLDGKGNGVTGQGSAKDATCMNLPGADFPIYVSLGTTGAGIGLMVFRDSLGLGTETTVLGGLLLAISAYLFFARLRGCHDATGK